MSVKGFHAAQGDGFLPFRVSRIIQFQAWQAFEQDLEGLVRFDPGELSAETQVDVQTANAALLRAATRIAVAAKKK